METRKIEDQPIISSISTSHVKSAYSPFFTAEIKFVEYAVDLDCLGMCIYHENTILVCEGPRPSENRKTLIHELTHMVLRTCVNDNRNGTATDYEPWYTCESVCQFVANQAEHIIALADAIIEHDQKSRIN